MHQNMVYHFFKIACGGVLLLEGIAEKCIKNINIRETWTVI
jgi:hypothetical protein